MWLADQPFAPEPLDPVPAMKVNEIQFLEATVPTVSHYHLRMWASVVGATQHILEVVVIDFAFLW